MEHGAALRPAPLLFKTHNNTDLKAQVGTTAVLHCVAYHVGENTYVQVRDDGVYECQVSSHPPVSLLTTLHVTEATSEVLGGPEKYVRVGSSLRLVCVLKNNTQPPEYVFWYHGPHMINFHATREVRVEQKGEVSTLYLNHVRASDSGNYTCAPSKARPAHILIHVLKGGETPAAIHSGAGESKEGGGFSSTSSLLLLLVLLQLITLPLTSPCVLVPSPSHHSQRYSSAATRGLGKESKDGGGKGGGRGNESCPLPLSRVPTSSSGGGESEHISRNTKDKITS
ncbi:hypothetical protein O3P69_005442 [Scylla paramamosain]|uniref:Ig-like domain-containing protein n=1 Tax=Scylla paramamosain TaxID=85552 RepID=A0AAW0UBR9_SCYPA